MKRDLFFYLMQPWNDINILLVVEQFEYEKYKLSQKKNGVNIIYGRPTSLHI